MPNKIDYIIDFQNITHRFIQGESIFYFINTTKSPS